MSAPDNPRNLVLRLTPVDAKAAEDSRSPGRFASSRRERMQQCKFLEM